MKRAFKHFMHSFFFLSGMRSHGADLDKTCLNVGLRQSAVIFLGVRPASCTHYFARGRKKLASVSPVDS